MSQVSMEELKKTMPWQEIVHPNGLIQVIDAQGKEVPIFVMLGLLRSVTAHIARDVNRQTQQA